MTEREPMSNEERLSITVQLPEGAISGDVLERVRECHAKMAILRGSDHYPLIILADAIAEIERLGRAHEVVVAAYNLAHQEVETLQSRLHTEAKAVLYQWRFLTAPGQPASTWFECSGSYYRAHTDDPKQVVRALAVVAPRGDTEE